MKIAKKEIIALWFKERLIVIWAWMQFLKRRFQSISKFKRKLLISMKTIVYFINPKNQCWRPFLKLRHQRKLSVEISKLPKRLMMTIQEEVYTDSSQIPEFWNYLKNLIELRFKFSGIDLKDSISIHDRWSSHCL